MKTLKDRRLKIETEYLKLFKLKHDYGEFDLSGGLICFHDGYYTFSMDLIYFDIDNNCAKEEPFKWIEWGVENPKYHINYETWIKFGGSANTGNIKELFQKKIEDEIEDNKKSQELIRQVLDNMINGVENEKI